MTNIEKQFDESIEKALRTALLEYSEAKPTILRLKELILIKGKEYRRNNDPYHNFNQGAKLMQVRPMTVLHFFRLKHLISVADLQKDWEGGRPLSLAQVNEKYDDILVYTLIELAYNEHKNEASFNAFSDFIKYLVDKTDFIKKIHG